MAEEKSILGLIDDATTEKQDFKYNLNEITKQIFEKISELFHLRYAKISDEETEGIKNVIKSQIPHIFETLEYLHPSREIDEDELLNLLPIISIAGCNLIKNLPEALKKQHQGKEANLIEDFIKCVLCAALKYAVYDANIGDICSEQEKKIIYDELVKAVDDRLSKHIRTRAELTVSLL